MGKNTKESLSESTGEQSFIVNESWTILTEYSWHSYWRAQYTSSSILSSGNFFFLSTTHFTGFFFNSWVHGASSSSFNPSNDFNEDDDGLTNHQKYFTASAVTYTLLLRCCCVLLNVSTKIVFIDTSILLLEKEMDNIFWKKRFFCSELDVSESVDVTADALLYKNAIVRMFCFNLSWCRIHDYAFQAWILQRRWGHLHVCLCRVLAFLVYFADEVSAESLFVVDLSWDEGKGNRFVSITCVCTW